MNLQNLLGMNNDYQSRVQRATSRVPGAPGSDSQVAEAYTVTNFFPFSGKTSGNSKRQIKLSNRK
jgi:hypothetical protein